MGYGVEYDCIEDDLAAFLPSGDLIILNRTGKFIFQDLVLEGRTGLEASRHLSEAFGINESRASSDAGEFIDLLVSKGVIRRAAEVASFK